MYEQCPLILRIRDDERTTKDYFLTFSHSSGFYEERSAVLTHGVGSSIIDEIVDYSSLPPGTCNLKKNKLLFKEVTNSDVVVDTLSPDVANTADFSSDSSTWDFDMTNGYITAFLDADPLSPTKVLLDANHSNSVRDGMLDLQPSFKDAKVNGINLYTVILELGDLRKTFSKSAYKLGKTLGHTAAEKNLLINFGILPLFGDIVAMFDIITKLSDYIDKWNHAAKSGVVWDKHTSVPDVTFTGNEVVNFTPGLMISPLHTWTCESPDYSTTATTKLHLYFRPKPIADADRKKVFYRALGLDKPLAGAWEAVPFSWLVDYFVNIGDMIDTFDEAIPSMFKYEYISAGYSVKSTVKGSFNYSCVTDPGTLYTVQSNPAPFSRAYESNDYIRRRLPMKTMFEYMAKPDELVVSNGLSFWRTSYIASLAFLKTFK